MEFEGYTIEEPQAGVFAIDDEKGDSMYLIVGSEKALLIDTCLMKPDILPMLKTLTDKPIELALTHAHIDHMYHCGEFDRVYLHENDIAAWKSGALVFLYYSGCLMFHLLPKKNGVGRFIPLMEGSVIPLGDNDVQVVPAFGHTPGSCIFVDTKHEMLFVGDAIGNGGASAWMWLPASSVTSEYQKSLKAMLENLKPFETYRFLGGHRPNTLPTPELPEGQPITIQCIRDMDVLCSMMLDHSIEPVEKQRQSLLTIWQYAYGTTGIWVTKGKIK